MILEESLSLSRDIEIVETRRTVRMTQSSTSMGWARTLQYQQITIRPQSNETFIRIMI